MKKFIFIVSILMVSVFTTACINNLAVQELNNKAAEYMKNGDYENAISRLKSSVDLDPTIFETQYNLAVAYTENGDYDEAIETFEKASALDSKSKDLYYAMAVMYENYGNDLFTGNTKKQKEEIEEIDADDESPSKVQNDDGSYKPTDEELSNVKKYYEFSVDAYTKYLELAPDVNDSSEIQAKIQQLQDKVLTLSADATN